MKLPRDIVSSCSYQSVAMSGSKVRPTYAYLLDVEVELPTWDDTEEQLGLQDEGNMQGRP